MKHDSVVNVLMGLGLRYKEIEVYLKLNELGPSLANSLARHLCMNRSSVYLVLESLKIKSLVSTFTSKSVTYFQSVRPDELLQKYENKVCQLSEIIPFLESVKQTAGLKPRIELYEGREGLIQIMEDTLTSNDGHILFYADVTAAMKSLIKDYYPSYIKRRIEKNLLVKGIFCDTPDSLEFKKRSEEELREIYLLPYSMFPFQNEIAIYNNKFSMISHEDNMGVIIENESIAKTQKMIFNICWQFAKNFESSNCFS